MASKTYNYILRVILTKFFGARVIDMENEDGIVEKHVCIPLDSNNLKLSKNGSVSAYMFMTESNVASPWGWTHYLKLKSATAFVKKMDALGFDTPYMGNAKAHNYVVYKKSYREQFVKAKDYE